MAEPLKYQVPKPEWTVTKTADEELRQLVELLHERGVLRLANDFLFSMPSITRVFLEGVDNQAGSNAIQNLTALVELVGNLPPEQFRRLCRGLTLALVATTDEEAQQAEAPGVTGAVKLLHDDELWQAVGPLLHALRAFSQALRESTDLSPHGGPRSTDR